MIRTNPDPHAHGYRYFPTGAVTAYFGPDVDSRAAIQGLLDAGIPEDQIEIFSGPDGAQRLDAPGRRHGLWVRFRRALEEVFSDGYEEFVKADEILRSGGAVVAVFTLKDEEKRRRAVDILIANRGEDVTYWGPVIHESFSLGRTRVPAATATPAGLRPLLERDLRREEEAVADYRHQADRAGALGLAALKTKLEHMATDGSAHARELRRVLEGL